MLCSRSASFMAATLVSADSTAAITRAAVRPPLPRMLLKAMTPATIAAACEPNTGWSGGPREG